MHPAGTEYYLNYLAYKEDILRKHRKAMHAEGIMDEADIFTDQERFLRGRERDLRGENMKRMGSWAFSNGLGSACNGRRFAVTEKGIMALEPLLAERGDRVVLVFGADVPFLFRECPVEVSREMFGKRKCWYLVGECLVHGIMDGEGLKEPGEGSSQGGDFVVL